MLLHETESLCKLVATVILTIPYLVVKLSCLHYSNVNTNIRIPNAVFTKA